MTAFYLKKYARQIPSSSVGTLIAEWTIEAPSDALAVQAAREKLIEAGFTLPSDFAILRNVTGKKIWEIWGRSGRTR